MTENEKNNPFANLITLDESLRYLNDQLRTALEGVTEALAAVATIRGTVREVEAEDEPTEPLTAFSGKSYVLLGDVAQSPDAPEIDPHDLIDLAVEIGRDGQRTPLVIRPDPEDPGRYRLVHGRRQLAALRLLGREIALVIVADEG